MTDITVQEAIARTSEAATVDPAQGATSTGDYLLDVREQDEWDRGHAPSAHHLAMSTLGERIDEIPAGASILVICHSGGRSARVTGALSDAGFDAVNVAGGMLAWQSAGGVVVADGDAVPTV